MAVEKRGTLGVIRLNRPAALNSLNLEMVQLIDAALDRFEADPDIVSVLLHGAGDRGLCAGGDIRALLQSIVADDGLWTGFLSAEYKLNARIARLTIPYIALMDGITMGGGVGLSAHGRYRVATDRLRLAMPEVGIGFFPDVGASWLLSREGSELGTYLALTGRDCGAGTVIAAGLADVCVAHQDVEQLIGDFADLRPGEGHKMVSSVISRLQTPHAAPDPEFLALVERCFAGRSVEAILDGLVRERSQMADEILAALRGRCPTSLKVTLRLLRIGRTSTNLESCLAMEFAAARHVLRRPDFQEGIRAALIDKDHAPRWRPGRLQDVEDAEIDAWLRPDDGPDPLWSRGERPA